MVYIFAMDESPAVYYFSDHVDTERQQYFQKNSKLFLLILHQFQFAWSDYESMNQAFFNNENVPVSITNFICDVIS